MHFASFFIYAWEQRKLGEVFQYERPDKYIVKNDEYSDTAQTPVLTANKAFILGYTNENNTYNNPSIIFDDFTLDCKYVDFPYMVKSSAIKILTIKDKNRDNLLFAYELLNAARIEILGHARHYISVVQPTLVRTPSKKEQKQISSFFGKLDTLITLHQRKYFLFSINLQERKGDYFMLDSTQNNDLFCEYYAKWIKIYKEGAIRKVTLGKYLMTNEWLKRLIPNLKIGDLNRITYQQLLNDYAEHHERQTTMDFHHQLKGAILDAVDEGLIEKDPTRKAIIKGKTPREKKFKYLNQFELHTLLSHLNLGEKINWDWFILLVAKTGMRFSEALALTPKDFDFAHQSLSISKTWNYKENGGFLPTKNRSSVRKIQIDWQTVIQFSELLKNKSDDVPIFVNFGQNIYNSTVNGILERHCKSIKVPIISIHGLRHTHASLLLFAGVSIASVARRLGHSSMTTTQKTYLHIIHELENKDVDLVMRSLSGLN